MKFQLALPTGLKAERIYFSGFLFIFIKEFRISPFSSRVFNIIINTGNV